MRPEPRVRVSAVLRWRGQVLLCRHEKRGNEHWLLPGGDEAAAIELADKVTLMVRAGDVLRIRTPGGGGWGDPTLDPTGDRSINPTLR